MQGKHLGYRPDIDGLRALAVLALIIFHFNKEWLPGGFVGVEIFFVISGYLITGIISRQAERGEFSFAEFYLPRIRRIVPVTLFVTLASVIFGACFMLPEDSRSLSKSAIAATFSAANIYFWKFLDTGYFAASSDTVPPSPSLVARGGGAILPALASTAHFRIKGRRAIRSNYRHNFVSCSQLLAWPKHIDKRSKLRLLHASLKSRGVTDWGGNLLDLRKYNPCAPRMDLRIPVNRRRLGTGGFICIHKGG